MNDIALQIKGVKKQYKLGQIGGGTLTADLQSWWARKRGKEDPNMKIGTDQRLFGQTFYALNGINLTIKKGEAVGIIGKNGAGKSTLLKLISRVTAPTEGSIDIYGRITSMLEVGTGFHPEMTGRENVYLNGAILGMTKAEIDRKMEEIIDFSEVREFIDTPVKRYSSGMYVKLAFSVAAHLDSEIMIMDEVLAVGDMAFQKKCLDKMRDAANAEGKTILYVSHNMNTIRQLCDRCIVLDKGKIVFAGEVEKAIEVYLGERGDLSTYYKYTEEFHQNRLSSDQFVIDTSEVEQIEEMLFDCGSVFSFYVTCKTKQEFRDVWFRFEIEFQDGIKVGTMFSDSGSYFEKNSIKTVPFMFNTAHLTPGRYIVDIIAYVFDDFGNEQFLDGVYPGFVFELTETLNETNQLIWLHQYWGHVHLQDVIVKSGLKK